MHEAARPAPTKPEIKSLTGLRGLAATLVMLDHYAAIDFSYPFPLNMLPHMYLAVDMFMLLSGFILARAYQDRLNRQTFAEGSRLFILHRVARLYPLYALTTIVSFGLCRAGWLTFLHPDTSVAALVANLLAIQTWAWPGSSLDGPGWSISAEWFANLLFPVLLLLVLGRSRTLAAWVGSLALGALVLSAIVSGQLFDVPSPGAVNVISGPGALGRCVGEFAIGMACWRLRSGSSWARALGSNQTQIALSLALFVLLQYTALDTVFVLVCALLLVGLSYDTSIVSSALRWTPLMHLGRISFSIYLVHVTLLPIRDRLALVFESRSIPGAWFAAVFCSAVLAVLLATLTSRYVERPAQQAILASGRERQTRASF